MADQGYNFSNAANDDGWNFDYDEECGKPLTQSPLPNGTYNCFVTEVSRRDYSNNRGSGRVIKLKLKVMDGEYTNREIEQVFFTHSQPSMKLLAIQIYKLCAVRSRSNDDADRNADLIINCQCKATITGYYKDRPTVYLSHLPIEAPAAPTPDKPSTAVENFMNEAATGGTLDDIPF